jgi:hypothetical protein
MLLLSEPVPTVFQPHVIVAIIDVPFPYGPTMIELATASIGAHICQMVVPFGPSMTWDPMGQPPGGHGTVEPLGFDNRVPSRLQLTGEPFR